MKLAKGFAKLVLKAAWRYLFGGLVAYVAGIFYFAITYIN